MLRRFSKGFAFGILVCIDYAIISKGVSRPLLGFAWSHAEDQKGKGFILGGFQHRVAASLVLLVSTRPALSCAPRWRESNADRMSISVGQ